MLGLTVWRDTARRIHPGKATPHACSALIGVAAKAQIEAQIGVCERTFLHVECTEDPMRSSQFIGSSTHTTGPLCEREFRISVHLLKIQLIDELSHIYSPKTKRMNENEWLWVGAIFQWVTI